MTPEIHITLYPVFQLQPGKRSCFFARTRCVQVGEAEAVLRPPGTVDVSAPSDASDDFRSCLKQVLEVAKRESIEFAGFDSFLFDDQYVSEGDVAQRLSILGSIAASTEMTVSTKRLDEAVFVRAVRRKEDAKT